MHTIIGADETIYTQDAHNQTGLILFMSIFIYNEEKKHEKKSYTYNI